MRNQRLAVMFWAAVLALPATALADDKKAEDGWVKLFNGRDLKGWKTHPDKPGKWQVEHGMLVSRGEGVSHLFSEHGDFENFHLRVEAKINAKGNSGVFFRSEYGLNLLAGGKTGSYPKGYEAQIEVGGTDPQKTGSLCNFVRVTDKLAAADVWFTLEVIAEGKHIFILVDGKRVVDYVDDKATYAKGHVALQQANTETLVRFRKIEIKLLPKQAVAKKPWGVVLCKFSDLPDYEPHPVSFYKEAFTEAGAGKGRDFDYFRQVSYGNIDMTGSKVFGWFTMPNHSTKDLATLKYPSPGRSILHDWGAECARANRVDLSEFFGVLVIFNNATDSGKTGGRRVVIGFLKKDWEPPFTFHELGHGFGLDHARLARPLTEYGDRWDIMGSGLYRIKTKFGEGGPGLNAYHLRQLGCIPNDRIWTADAKSASQTITLAALNQFDAPGYLMASIPPAPGSASKSSYLVEFRRKKGWDAGIPRDTVLVHEDRGDGYPYLLSRDGRENVYSIEVLANQDFIIAKRNVTIKAVSFDANASTAKVTISAGGALAQDKDALARDNDPRNLWIYEGGWYQRIYGNRWLEVNSEIYAEGKRFDYVEVKRTKDYVEILDKGRNVRVRLSNNTEDHEWGDGNWQTGHKGRWTNGDALAQGNDAPAQHNALRSLWVCEGGWYQKTNGKDWIEVNSGIYADGTTFKYVEVNRTKASVELLDKSRNVRVSLSNSTEIHRFGDQGWQTGNKGRWTK